METTFNHVFKNQTIRLEERVEPYTPGTLAKWLHNHIPPSCPEYVSIIQSFSDAEQRDAVNALVGTRVIYTRVLLRECFGNLFYTQAFDTGQLARLYKESKVPEPLPPINTTSSMTLSAFHAVIPIPVYPKQAPELQPFPRDLTNPDDDDRTTSLRKIYPYDTKPALDDKNKTEKECMLNITSSLARIDPHLLLGYTATLFTPTMTLAQFEAEFGKLRFHKSLATDRDAMMKVLATCRAKSDLSQREIDEMNALSAKWRALRDAHIQRHRDALADYDKQCRRSQKQREMVYKLFTHIFERCRGHYPNTTIPYDLYRPIKRTADKTGVYKVYNPRRSFRPPMTAALASIRTFLNNPQLGILSVLDSPHLVPLCIDIAGYAMHQQKKHPATTKIAVREIADLPSVTPTFISADTDYGDFVTWLYSEYLYPGMAPALDVNVAIGSILSPSHVGYLETWWAQVRGYSYSHWDRLTVRQVVYLWSSFYVKNRPEPLVSYAEFKNTHDAALYVLPSPPTWPKYVKWVDIPDSVDTEEWSDPVIIAFLATKQLTYPMIKRLVARFPVPRDTLLATNWTSLSTATDLDTGIGWTQKQALDRGVKLVVILPDFTVHENGVVKGGTVESMLNYLALRLKVSLGNHTLDFWVKMATAFLEYPDTGLMSDVE